MALSPAEKQAAYRDRKRRDGEPPRPPLDSQAFPARVNDLAPSAAALKRLGATFGSRQDRSTR